MSVLLSFRVPRDFYREIRESAARNGVSLSQEIKDRLSRLEQISEENSLIKRIEKILPSTPSDNDSGSRSPYPLLVEAVLLLRELIIRRDSQILRKVDAELNQIFGHDRKKIYES